MVEACFNPSSMEYTLFLTSFLMILPVMAVHILTDLFRGRKNSNKLRLPPGPNPLPIIGNIHQLGGSPFIHRLLRDLANKYGPLMHLKLGETSTIVVTSPEMAKEIYKTNDLLFASRPLSLKFKIFSYNFLGIVFSPYGNHWRQLRKICTMELLTPNRVQSFRSIREDEVFKLIGSISPAMAFNLTRAITSLSYGIVGLSALGEKNEDTDKHIRLIIEISHLASGFSIADMYPSVKLFQVVNPTTYKMERAMKQIDEIVGNILREHKEKMDEANGAEEELREDLVDVLINIQKRNEFQPQLTDTCIKAVIFVSEANYLFILLAHSKAHLSKLFSTPKEDL